MQASPSPPVDHSPDHITHVANAYRTGLRKPLPYHPRPDDPSLMLERLPLEDEIRILESGKLHGSVMKEARSGDPERAMRRLQVAAKYLDIEAMERESICVALQLHKGVEAYVYYRSEEYEAARRSMKEALRLMNELQEQFGYGFCDGRRVHLARNLLRLDAHGGAPVRAARTAFKLLLYTTGDDQAWPYPSLQSKAENRCMTDVERHMVFNQVARELVLLFLHADAATHPALLVEGETGMQHVRRNDAVEEDPRIVTTLQWLDVKRPFVEDRLDDFMEQAARFFRSGRSVPALWYGVALDVARACDVEGGADAQSLRQQIVDDAGTWKRLLRVDYSIAFSDE